MAPSDIESTVVKVYIIWVKYYIVRFTWMFGGSCFDKLRDIVT